MHCRKKSDERTFVLNSICTVMILYPSYYRPVFPHQGCCWWKSVSNSLSAFFLKFKMLKAFKSVFPFLMG